VRKLWNSANLVECVFQNFCLLFVSNILESLNTLKSSWGSEVRYSNEPGEGDFFFLRLLTTPWLALPWKSRGKMSLGRSLEWVTIGGTSSGSRWSDQSGQQDYCLNHQQRRPASVKLPTRRHRSLLNLLRSITKKSNSVRLRRYGNVNPCLYLPTPLPPTNSPRSKNFHFVPAQPTFSHTIKSSDAFIPESTAFQVSREHYGLHSTCCWTLIPRLVFVAASQPYVSHSERGNPLVWIRNVGPWNLTCLQIHHSLRTPKLLLWKMVQLVDSIFSMPTFDLLQSWILWPCSSALS
jgi:hypothetical protein